MFEEKDLKFFDRHSVARPSQDKHGVDSWENPIGAELRRLKCTNWRMEGNKLIADTEQGQFVQFIPTNYICHGSDQNGLPILKKLVV